MTEEAKCAADDVARPAEANGLREWLDAVRARANGFVASALEHGPPHDFSTVVWFTDKDGNREILCRVEMENDATPEFLDLACAAPADILRLLDFAEEAIDRRLGRLAKPSSGTAGFPASTEKLVGYGSAASSGGQGRQD